MTKILVISNKEEDLTTISALLNDLVSDCLVITARSGLKGIEKAKTEPPSTILLDIEMSEMEGYDVCNRLKSNEKTKHIPIIMITEVKSGSIRRLKGLEAGADIFLNKPFDEVELTAQINMALRIDKTEKEKILLYEMLQKTRKMEAIGNLAGGIVHEFNNILFPIIGYAEMSMYDMSENSRVKNNLKKILKAAGRAKQLVQQILDYRGQDDQEKKPLKVQYIIKEILKLMRASFLSTIEIRQNIDNACGAVLASPSEIQQLIMDLCTNAHHAMKEKGGVLEVALSEVDIDSDDLSSKTDLKQGSYLQLTVSHTGHEEGTPIDLTGACGILESCQGNINIGSDPEKGTTVKVYLPLIDTRSDKTPAISTDQDIPTGNESILLVDDEEDVVEMMHFMLEKLGYQVISRDSSIEALDTFRKQPEKFDLVITDQTMPEMTGLELARQLILIRPDIPVILSTGYSQTIEEDSVGAQGIRACVMKPVRIREIAVKIRKVLDHK
jgi:CheY-like chemotaxis protein